MDSLARPGGNVTGLTQISIELLGKRLELLKEVLSKVSRFAYLDDSCLLRATKRVAKETQSVAKALGVQLQGSRSQKRPIPISRAYSKLWSRSASARIITKATPHISFDRISSGALARTKSLFRRCIRRKNG